MKKTMQRVISSLFVRNVIVLVSGTASAQIIAILSSPIITRLYGPKAYGLMGVFQSIIQIIIPLAALTYPVAIILPKRNNDAIAIIRLSMCIAVILSIISLIMLLIFGKQIIKTFGLQEIGPFLFLIPLVILFSGFMEVYEQWLIRTKQFGITAKSAVYRSLIINGSRIGIGLFYPIASVLIVLATLENGLRAFIMRYYLRKTGFKMEDNQRTLLIDMAQKYKDFPLYRAPQEFLERFSQSMPIFLLSYFFGAATAGFFTIGRTVLSLPSLLIGKSIGDVFYPRISEASKNGENLNKLIIQATISLALVGVIPFGIITFFGPDLFSILFGSEWVMAGEYARWMSVWMFCTFINRPSTRALPVMSAQAFQLKYAVLTLILRVVAFGSAYYIFNDDLIAIASLALTAGLLSIGLILLTLKIGKRFD